MGILINKVFATCCFIGLHYYILGSFDNISDFMMRLYVRYPVNKTLIFFVYFDDPSFPLGEISVIVFTVPCNNLTALAAWPHAAFDFSGLPSSRLVIEVLLLALNVIVFVS